MNPHLIFLKLGGSLITDKTRPHSAHRELISHLGQEILEALKRSPDIQLILGHGSGSFGHIPAKKYGTRKGVSTSEDWVGFWEVWKEAHELDQIILEEFQRIDMRIISFPPSAMVVTLDHKVINWDTRPLQTAVENGIIPMVYGDVVFDPALGGTILSTEELFTHLAGEFKPFRIILVGKEKGIYKDFPKTEVIIPQINHENIQDLESAVHGASTVDVTGGMLSKMKLMWELCENDPNLSIDFCSADDKSPLHEIILGSCSGTRMQY
jgi:isopentenyl phosphate kinase